MLRKLILTCLGLSISSIALAGAMGPAQTCATGVVSVPCEAKAWDIGVQALYLQSVIGGKRRLVAMGETIHDLDDDWGWGYRLEGSYHFSTGNDISLNWTHFNQSSNFSGLEGFIAPFNATFPFGLNHKVNFDQVNIVLGQHVDVGLLKNIRFYGGLQYADMRSDHTRNFTVTPQITAATGVTGIKGYGNSDFKGVGPTVGTDFAYDVANGFSITAETSTSILYGRGRDYTGLIFAPTGLIPVSLHAAKDMIVPSVEAKLGAKYVQAFAEGQLSLVGGYQALNYFHALHSIPLSTDSDFGLFGPYFGLNWLGNL